ncbi:MAG: FAD-dependent oxidoreductase, partial [Acidimicrobiales bacterium]
AGAGAPAQTMTAADVAARFPAVAVTGPALFEPTSGVIAADGYLAAMAGTPGVTVRPGCRVTSLIEEGRRVRVVLDGPDGTGDMVAEAAVVCAGPWTAALVAGLDTGLRPLATLEQVAYLQPVAGASAEVPVVVERRRPWFYGLPDPAQGRYKVSLHGAGPALVLDDAPGWRPHGDEPDEALVAELVACSGRVLPGFDPHPVATERCLYDNTPDGDFVLDRVGRIAFGCGTSGHGFKFAPLLGEILADLAVGALHHPVGSLVDRGRFASARLRSLGPATGPAVHP